MTDSSSVLSISEHSRESAGMVYVYPVISRRAGGVSIGINLNVNNACNWRCIYCQVPGLSRGGPPPIDLGRLEHELADFLAQVIEGDFMACRVPEGARALVDVAFSGNGEPTTAREFPEALDIVGKVVKGRPETASLPIRLITNGSQMDRPRVREAVSRLGQWGGEAWIKVDCGTPAGLVRINGTRTTPAAVARRVDACGTRCPTWIQTCVFSYDGHPPTSKETEAYLRLLSGVCNSVKGVHLYGLARPSCQPEAEHLGNVPVEWLQALAVEVEKLGLPVKVSP